MSAVTSAPAAPEYIQALVERYDPSVFDARQRTTRVRLEVTDGADWDVVITDGVATVGPTRGQADALLAADARLWRKLAADLSGGLSAYRNGRLSLRRNMHVGVGFLAATSGDDRPGRLRFRHVDTRRAGVSILEAGTGPAVLALHGLGATKGSFLPTVATLSRPLPGDRRRPARLRRLGQADRRRLRRPLLRRRGDRPAGRARDRSRPRGRQQPRRARRARDRVAQPQPREPPRPAGALAGLAAGGACAAPAPAPHAPGARARAGGPEADRRANRAHDDPRRERGLGGRRCGRVPARVPHALGQGGLLRGRSPRRARGAPRRAGLLDAPRGACSPRPCSCGVATTGSFRSPSPATSPRRCPGRSISSSTAATSPRSSFRARRMPRSRRSCRVRPGARAERLDARGPAFAGARAHTRSAAPDAPCGRAAPRRRLPRPARRRGPDRPAPGPALDGQPHAAAHIRAALAPARWAAADGCDRSRRTRRASRRAADARVGRRRARARRRLRPRQFHPRLRARRAPGPRRRPRRLANDARPRGRRHAGAERRIRARRRRPAALRRRQLRRGLLLRRALPDRAPDARARRARARARAGRAPRAAVELQSRAAARGRPPARSSGR